MLAELFVDRGEDGLDVGFVGGLALAAQLQVDAEAGAGAVYDMESNCLPWSMISVSGKTTGRAAPLASRWW
ncbi:hypothetical protein [Streptomyces sp. NPDC059631]|uniref:hypothetical protein n=1 Tax=unclassified Streptomyces TaxID=2593676 RepID=UPI00368F0331